MWVEGSSLPGEVQCPCSKASCFKLAVAFVSKSLDYNYPILADSIEVWQCETA